MRVVHVGHDVSGDPGPPRLSKVGEQSGVFCSSFGVVLPNSRLGFDGFDYYCALFSIVVSSIIRARRPGHSFQLVLFGLVDMAINSFSLGSDISASRLSHQNF